MTIVITINLLKRRIMIHMIDSMHVKEILFSLGADLCGGEQYKNDLIETARKFLNVNEEK